MAHGAAITCAYLALKSASRCINKNPQQPKNKIKPCPKDEPVQPFIFFRDEHFYVIEIPPSTVEDNVKRNEGTTKVLHAITQKQVWPIITPQTSSWGRYEIKN